MHTREDLEVTSAIHPKVHRTNIMSDMRWGVVGGENNQQKQRHNLNY